MSLVSLVVQFSTHNYKRLTVTIYSCFIPIMKIRQLTKKTVQIPFYLKTYLRCPSIYAIQRFCHGPNGRISVIAPHLTLNDCLVPAWA